MKPRYTPTELADALGLFAPTAEQAAVIAAPPGPLVVIAGAGAGKTETMAARVVWLVANGYAEPGQVLGLTFTRKAAGQLLRRVRSRLARLAGIGLTTAGAVAADTAGTPVVSTYHAFAGSLLRDHGLLLPVEPDTRLLSETELWQLAFDVVNRYGGALRTDKSPAAVTSMVLRLWGALAEHLVDTGQLCDTHGELERLVHTLPAGPYQRDRGPSQWLLRLLSTQTERAELVPLLDALQERMCAAKVMDFGAQMASAARLAAAFPQVGEELRNRYRVVLLDEYQDTGHAQRIALAALFGGGVDDGLALTAVGDPIQSIYGWRGASATNLPRFTTDFPKSDGSPAPILELRTSWRNPPSTLHVANAISAEARRRSVAVHALRARPDAPPGTVRCALLPDIQAERDWIADHVHREYERARAEGVAPPTAAVLVRRNADAVCLADAISDPGAADAYSFAGYQRIAALAGELTALRGHLAHSLPDLVAEVRRVLGVDCEARAAAGVDAGWSGAEHLDAFADVVAGYAERAGAGGTDASVAALLAYLDAAETVENGLPPAPAAVARDRVQVLTVHSAKGLEWQVVAVAHLSGGVFPSTASRSSWLTDPGELPPLLRGDRASAGALGIPVLDTSSVTNRKQLSDTISEHRRQLDQRRVDEERRLLYVAATRAEDTLLVSGHHWGGTGAKPRGPSDFLCELKDVIDQSAADGEACGVVEQWAPAPADAEPNPLRDNVIEAVWPADPLAARRGAVERGAALVAQAMSVGDTGPGEDVDGWAADVDALLAERARSAAPPVHSLPGQVSVSGLVDLARDPAAATQRLLYRLPTRPDPHAQLGSAFHAWVQQFYGAEWLFDLGDLPGAADSEVGEPTELAALQAAFTESPWAARTPTAVEVPFEMPIGDRVVRGRIDAVFADPDGGFTVVDWKTGEPPRGAEALRHAAVQLAVYRMAWAALSAIPESAVRTAFYYVRTRTTVAPDALPGQAELAELLADPAGNRPAEV